MNTRPIRFFHRGRTVEVTDATPTRTVLEWLREDQRCTGTKEGCAEGDCGACTVVLGTLDAAGGLALQPVNACIQFLPTIDGKALFTVEDLRSPEGLHPVQQQMVACHGSQCGFCTPGFVMSLWACSERHLAAGTRPSRRELADDLSGNLCRCTGYRPILDAGQRVFEQPARPLDRAPVVQALQALRAESPLHYAASTPGAAVFHAPRTADELARLRAERPEARLLAGGTDIGLWVTKQFRELGELIYLGAVDELRRIEPRDGWLRVGAAATLEDGWRAIAGHWPDLREVWLRFASRPIREAGTLVGNLANGSPIGDTAPALIALGARVQLRQGSQRRTLPLEDFYVDYMKNRLAAGEFIEAVEVPMAPASGGTHHVRAWKISKRYDCDISAVCAGLALTLDDGVVREARLAFGGMAAIVRRASEAEAALAGRPWGEAALRGAQAALERDFTPLSDMRASSGYRLQVARNLLERLWLETRPGQPLAAPLTQVWQAEAALGH